MHEVEYILWLLSSKEEEGNYPSETDKESTGSDEDSVGCHVKDEHCIECTSKVEDDKGCIYSLEKLLCFQSLYKLCGDIQKLR